MDGYESDSFIPQVGELAAEIEHGTEDCQMTKLTKTMEAASLFLTPEQQDCVTLKAGGKSFTFKKDILTHHSEYFATCFKNKNFVESQTLTVEFDDVDPNLLGIYLHFAYIQAATNIVKFDPGMMDEPKRLKPMIRLFDLADRFMNVKMTALLGPAITSIAMDHPITNSDGKMTPEMRAWSINNYKEAFEALDKGNQAHDYMRESIVASYCHCIPLNYFGDDLHYLTDNPEFVKKIMVRLAEFYEKSKHRPRCAWGDSSRSVEMELPSHWNTAAGYGGWNETRLSGGNWQHWMPLEVALGFDDPFDIDRQSQGSSDYSHES
ncbi:hypothetical protein K4K49_002657 [Colletotrichum sp. SAR 10_70]|nr:hypothetical protein K4K50_004013 [Colletotrichum sp. SAR 10_71]KAI8175309.1 hypothetical protein K4K49_002657 [Colletotrichum sp. SAR 10_70]KAI8206477.1 hypothetical protein K4K52_003125 [Colletotrichum sp. SAR 10_76]KAI8238412.1 hypothetical protein K4K54_000025 [Colletotrichum sp. SAR 10_86]